MSCSDASSLPRLFVLGDSISLQYGPYLERALQGCMQYRRKGGLAEAEKNLDIPKGANGGDSVACLHYVRHLLERGDVKTDVFMMNCGLHDTARRLPDRALSVDIETYEANLNALLTEIGKMSESIVWVRTTPVCEAHHNADPEEQAHRYQSEVDAYNAVADRVMQTAGVPSIDLHHFTRNQGDIADLSPDGRHFIDSVKAAQGAYIAGWLTAHFDLRPIATKC